MVNPKAPDEPIKRRKPDHVRKDEQVRIRLTAEQKEAFAEAAAKAGLDISSWLRWLGVRECQDSRAK